MNIEYINGIEYHEVTLRGRTKLIAKDGSAINFYKRNQKVTIHYNEDGYPCFGGKIPVHLYVAYGWVDGYFEGAEVNHKDFNIENYHADNLEWVTHKENVQYSVKNNSKVWNDSKKGVLNGRANFTDEEIREIRRKYDSGMSVSDILKIDHPEMNSVKLYRSLHSTYLNICKRKTWKHIC